MSRSSVSAVGRMDEFKAVAMFAGGSTTAVLTSFFVATLPLVQWFAALTAIVSGVVGVCWVAVQYRRSKR